MRRSKRTHDDLRAEIDAHLQLEAEALRAEGHSDAESAARRAFGNRTATEERYYEATRWRPLDQAARDLRFALRVLRKDWRFSALAVLGLGLGIGISTAIFELVTATYQAANGEGPYYVRLLRLENGRPSGDFSYPEYRRFQESARSFRSFEAISRRERFVLAAPAGEAQEIDGRFADGLVAGLGTAPQRNDAAALLLDYRFWKRRFGGDPNVVGRRVSLNAHAFTISGIADRRYNFADIYPPLAAQPLLFGENLLADGAAQWLMLGANLRPETPIARAQAEMEVLDRAQEPGKNRPADGGVLVSPGGSNPEKRKEILAVIVAVTLAVSMILLIACSNLANLLLARAASRRREIGVRLSLGASRARVVSQLLTESLLLALGGGVAGLLFAHWLARSLAIAAGGAFDVPFEITIEPRVIAYCLALSIATALSFGLGPALAATKTDVAGALHDGEREGVFRRSWSGRNLLVVTPLAVSLMLLLAAGVAIRRAQHSYAEGPRFDAARVIVMSFRLRLQGYTPAREREFLERLRARVAAMPAVASTALASAAPLGNGGGEARVFVTPEFFRTVGVAIVRGRGFAASDSAAGPPIAIVSHEYARRHWPGEEAIGKRANGLDVIGVAEDLEENPAPAVFLPYAQATAPPEMRIFARAASDVDSVKAGLRQEVRAADPGLLATIQTAREMLEESLGPARMVSLLLGILGALAVLMASVGIWAIMAYSVSRRTREIGIRLALGAKRGQILALVMRRTAVLIGWGIAIGLAGAVGLSRAMAARMAKLGHLDPATCAAVAVLLGVTALLAGYLPARRALRVDPAQSLRSE